MHRVSTLWLRTAITSGVLLLGSSAHAQGMPWEGPLSKILSSLTGPVAKVLGSIAIILLGFGLAFSEGGSFMRKALWVVIGLVIAFNAVSWALPFLGYGTDGSGG